MILRRVIAHFRNQEWTAIALDLLIVVVGVFIGIQVSNWNDDRRIAALEQSYLARLADDMRRNIARFESDIEFAKSSRDQLTGFLLALKDPVTSDADLVRHTGNYLTDGVFLAKLDATETTFNDLQSTGNLDIVRDVALREALVKLHAGYARGKVSFQINLDWVLQADSNVYIHVDAFRFDQRTAAYFPEKNTMDSAQYVRMHQDILRRHASLHFWLKDRAVDVLQEATEHTKAVLSQIEGT